MKRLSKILLLSSLLLITNYSMAQKKIVKLWQQQVESNGLVGDEVNVKNRISNVSEAELWLYKADTANNTRMAIVICPGGGYVKLAIDHEGEDFAEWLNKQGITAIVLKYRMPNKHKFVPLSDGQEAIKYVRQHAEELAIDSNKIGIAGFSAGGHLAASVSNHFSEESVSSRPDFSILYYPVISMTETAHPGSMAELLGDSPSLDDINYFSLEKQVTVNTPQTIIFSSYDDKTVSVLNSTDYYQALLDKGVKASIYLFPKGGHGWGMHSNFEYHEDMLSLLSKWLKDID